jgi:hypothetical protein
MPVSWVSISNMALRRIGVDTYVTNLESGTDKVSIACATSFEAARDEVLEGWDWKCAAARAILVKDAVAPVFGFACRYLLPEDPYCLVVREMHPCIADYVIEGRYLLTNVDSAEHAVKIRYTGRITEPGQLTALLARAIAWNLAAKISPSLNKGKEVQPAIMKEYGLIIEEAQSKNQQYDKDHNEDPGYWGADSLYDGRGLFVGGNIERFLNNQNSWVNGGTWLATH